MQAWCLGRRASGLCRFFIRIRTRPKLRLASILPFMKFRNRQASFLKWLALTKQQGRTPLCCVPIMKQGHAHCQNTTGGQHQDVHLQSQQRKPSKKDAVAHDQHNDGHVRSQKLFKRVDESHAKVRHTHESSTRLGAGEGSFMSCLQRQSSKGEVSFNSLSISSSSSSLSSSSSTSGSFHRVSGSKLKEACAKVVHGGPSICELVAGNQFLVHLSAAPVAATPPPHSSNGGLSMVGNTVKDKKCELSPSRGLPSLRHKESDINDRIVFFK